MTALHLTASIRAIERAGQAALDEGALMARAAQAVADQTARLARSLPRATPIVALVGPGNNGGDALLAIAMLRDRGFPAAALTLTGREPAAADALAVWRRWTAAGGRLRPFADLAEWLARDAIVVDGLFGIGLARPLDGDAAQAVAMLRPAARRVVAVDVPSGLDADTGIVVGGNAACAVAAGLTVTMIADKPGLHTAAGLDHAGRVVVAGLGLDALAATAPPADGHLLTPADAAAGIAPRGRDTHKGSFGSVLVIGGASGTAGAALLAARGAQSLGAGRVWIASPDAWVFDPGQPQLMTRRIDAAFDGLDAICIGCGLGQSEIARHALGEALRAGLPLTVDADALNLIASQPALARRLVASRAQVVLTPHPLEAARLLHTSAAAVQADRIGHALALAERFGKTVVLKGAGSIVASPGRPWDIVGSGCAALATAGTGDVLAGMVAALLGQHRDAHTAAATAAFVHGAAGDVWQQRHPSDAGLSAARLPELVADALDSIKA